MTRRAILLDRDGVLNRLIPGGYVLRPEAFHWLPGALAALRAAARAGWVCVVVTNQACIGRGLVSPEAMRAIHERMVAEAAAIGGRISGVFVCPHTPEHGCDCRKPQPGLLLRAARSLQLDLGCSWLIGDSATDVEAARAAGVRAVVVRTGMGEETLRQHPEWEAAEDVAGAVSLALAAP